MVAGSSYDIKLEYYQTTGDAQISLGWSSPSTPEEVIDPISQVGINNPDWTEAFTNLVEGARDSWIGYLGNPDRLASGRARLALGRWRVCLPGEPQRGSCCRLLLMTGTVHFSFQGSAAVSLMGNVNSSSLVYNYNTATNTTSGSFIVQSEGWNASYFLFSDSHRNGQAGGPGGITDLQLMRPTTPGATTSYAPGTIFTPQIVQAMSQYTVIRYQEVADQEMNWSDRTLPGYFNQNGGNVTAPHLGNGTASDDGASWEDKIMLANESGRDLMISLPPLATGESPSDVSSYIYNLANLIRYGSDGVNPYTSPQANPVYPPLNSNLRVYFEIGNELWNYSYPFSTDFANINSLTASHAAADDADFQAINYDNLPTTKDSSGNYTSMNTWRYREIMLRLIQISDIFRSVFGDEQMMSRIRPLYEWQYGDLNNTAQMALDFADKYFDDADGIQHVADPHPVNYYIWGGGGATYYGADNPDGLTTLIPDSGFDDTALPGGYNQDPASSTWTFSGTAGIAHYAGSASDIPPPNDGSQMGYITDKGSISVKVTFPVNQTSDVYALAFKALNRTKTGASTADAEDVRIYLDGVDITARTFSQENGDTPPGYDPNNPWMARNVFWALSDYYNTKIFTVAPGSTHTLTIQGMGDVANPSLTNQTVFLEDVQITSLDALFAGGLPAGGDANGQPVGQNYQNTLTSEVDWAKAYGLQDVAYEGGWSLGGDDGGSPLQLAAKFDDSRAASAQEQSLDMFYQAGGTVSVLGTYAQWQDWSDYTATQGLLNIDQSPLVQGVEDALDQPTVAPTNGITAPAVLKDTTITLASGANASTGQITSAGGWVAWNVIIPKTGTYNLVLTTSTSGGSAVLLADDQPIAAGVTGATLTGSEILAAGLHTIKVRSASTTAFTIGQITVVNAATPTNSPALLSAVGGNGTATLSWTAVAGATGYRVLYGAAPGQYTASAEAGVATSYTVKGLTDGATYYFAVEAENAAGASLPSSPLGATPLASGQSGSLAQWEFDGAAGGEAQASASASAGGVSVGALTRGPGLAASASGWAASLRANRFASEPAGNHTYGTTLAAAIAAGQYYQFTIAPASGESLSLSSLSFLAYFQNGQGSAGVTYSTDGVNFSAGLAASGSAASSSEAWTVDLSGRPDLQGMTGAVTVRIYLYGDAAYTLTALGDPSGRDLLVYGAVGDRAAPVVPQARSRPRPVRRWGVTGRRRLAGRRWPARPATGCTVRAPRRAVYTPTRREAGAGDVVHGRGAVRRGRRTTSRWRPRMPPVRARPRRPWGRRRWRRGSRGRWRRVGVRRRLRRRGARPRRRRRPAGCRSGR